MDLGLEELTDGDVLVVVVRGELDLGSAPRLRDLVVKRVTSGDRRVVLDLSEVLFLDSTGLGVLVAILKRLRTLGGHLGLVVTRERIRAVFELTNLLEVFAVADDRAAAVAAAATA